MIIRIEDIEVSNKIFRLLFTKKQISHLSNLLVQKVKEFEEYKVTEPIYLVLPNKEVFELDLITHK